MLIRFFNLLPKFVFELLALFFVWIMHGRMSKYGLHHSFQKQSHPTGFIIFNKVNQFIIPIIKSNKVVVKRKIESVDSNGYVYFNDGTKEKVDVIIYATGIINELI
jgi:hypothetical protein